MSGSISFAAMNLADCNCNGVRGLHGVAAVLRVWPIDRREDQQEKGASGLISGERRMISAANAMRVSRTVFLAEVFYSPPGSD